MVAALKGSGLPSEADFHLANMGSDEVWDIVDDALGSDQ